MKCVHMPIKYLINWYEETNMTGCVSIMSVFQDKIFWITDGVKFEGQIVLEVIFLQWF